MKVQPPALTQFEWRMLLDSLDSAQIMLNTTTRITGVDFGCGEEISRQQAIQKIQKLEEKIRWYSVFSTEEPQTPTKQED